MERTKTILKYTAWSLLGLVVAGVLFQQTMLIYDDYRFPPPGDLVDIGDRNIHVISKGDGNITIVFEAGFGAWSEHWNVVQNETANFAKTIAYDRAGQGWSDFAEIKTGFEVADDLNALLDALNEDRPVILVGASMGGEFIRAFAARYPEQVAGLVIVDSLLEASNLENLIAEYPQVENELRAYEGIVNDNRAMFYRKEFMLLLGIPRFMGNTGWRSDGEQRAHNRRSNYVTRRGYWETSLERYFQTKENENLANVPITIVAAGNNPFPMHRELQEAQAQLSQNSRFIVAENSGHDISSEHPEIIVEAIRELINRVNPQ